MADSCITDDDKVGICSGFLLEYSQWDLPHVLFDLRVILDNAPLYLRFTKQFVPKFNMEHLTRVHLANDKELAMITEYNYLEDDLFCDPKYRKLFRFDHNNNSVYNIEEWEPDPLYETWRAEFDAVFEPYIKNHYRNGVYSVFGSSENSFVTITICIENNIFNSKKYIAGQWRSVWIVDIVPGGSTAVIKGDIKIETRYNEHGRCGTLHTDTTKEVQTEVELLNPALTAIAVFDVVEQSENDAQQLFSIEDIQYRNDLFQPLRRHFPVTCEKFDWCRVGIKQSLQRELENVILIKEAELLK